MSAIAETDITFVIQGPVSYFDGVNVTDKCVASIQSLFPDSPVILSTWATDYVNQGICILVNEDPGEITTANWYFKNYNRMMVATHNGIQRSTTKFVARIRSDYWLDCTSDLKKKIGIIQAEGFDGLMGKILMAMSYDRHPLFAYYPSDLFHCGFRADMLKLWNGKMVEGFNRHAPQKTMEFLPRVIESPFYVCDVSSVMDYPYHSEQQLCIDFLDELGIEYDFKDHRDTSLIRLVKAYIHLSRYFAACSAHELGLRSYKHPVPLSPADTRTWDMAWKATSSRRYYWFFVAHLIGFYIKKQRLMASRFIELQIKNLINRGYKG